MSKESVYAELIDVLGLAQNDGEDTASFAERLALKANTLKDPDWETLTEPAQVWVNSALTALEEKKDIPLPEGMVSGSPEEAPETEQEEIDPETGEVVATPAPKTKAKKKTPSKAKAKFNAEKRAATGKPTNVKPPAVTKPKAAKKVKAANGTGTPGPKGTFSRGGKIKIVTKENPYREGTKSRGWFAVYKDGMTVEAAIAAGTPRHHIRWDLVQGNIKVS